MKTTLQLIFFFIILLLPDMLVPEIFPPGSRSLRESRSVEPVASIKTVNGKFYAYIVLLFNENPHFVNLVQKGTVSIKEMGNEGFHIRAYRSYLSSIQDPLLKRDAELMLNIYSDPSRFNDLQLQETAHNLGRRNIVLKFQREGYHRKSRLNLEYCIFGEKVSIDIKHPFLNYQGDIYYIRPFIYYDEFSTSNSTFYYDMIYINPEEVENDYIIAREVLRGREVRSMFFVGSRVTGDIRYCLQRSFSSADEIKREIWQMFTVHELTHKIMDNLNIEHDQITGEEMAMTSTIYLNPYLGLAVLYSYLNYNMDNPHRLAALNFIAFAAERTGKREFLDNPGLLKEMERDKLKSLAEKHFKYRLSNLTEVN